ncbi:MAG: hypothetical protein JRN26_02980 [Nitrososphaerota archaeon]|jgi:hypothetical protein|nr:hypothetical protein [Nitrososphaerota archaeon]MDG6935838.1 hypothetical protein [Nitrososphaerota archaeon]MDG6944605.1 hypothetical protein [Nitrososphaerota archaeon]
MTMKAVSSVIAGILVIMLALVAIGAVTMYFYSGLSGISQQNQLTQFLTYKEQESLQLVSSGSSLCVTNSWGHPTTITYLMYVSPSGTVSLLSVSKTIFPDQNVSILNVLQLGYSYAILTSYGNEFWASYGVSNPALNKYNVTIERNAPLGTTTPAVGTYTYPFGTKLDINASPNNGYYFAGWQGTGYQSYSGTSTEGTVYVWSGIVEKAVFGVEINFSETGASSGPVLVVNGTSYSANQLPLSLKVAYGDELDFQWLSPITVSNGVRDIWNSTAGLSGSRSGTMVAMHSGWVNATYKTQYALTMKSSPANGGTTTPQTGTHWLYPLASVSISETPSIGHYFEGWSGTGSGSYSGSSPSAIIRMNSPITETANYGTIYVRLSFEQSGLNSSAHGTVLSVSYDGYAYSIGYSSLPYSITVPYGTNVSFSYQPSVAGSNYYRWVWNSTSGLAGVQAGTITAKTNGTVTGNYNIQYEFIFEEIGLPDGAVWSVSLGGNSYSAQAGSEISLWSNLHVIYWSASNVSYDGAAYFPSPGSGSAAPGITVIVYDVPVTGKS